MAALDDENGKYPAGYTSIGQRVDATIQRIRGIDQQMENVPKDSKPAFELHPPGVRRPFNPPGQQARRLEYLQSEREKTFTDAWKQIEKETPVAKGKEATVARDTARQALFPNPYRHLNKEGLSTERLQSRDLEKSQDYMDAVRIAKAAERAMTAQEEQPVLPANEEKKPMSLSERYSQKLDRHIKQGREMVKPDPTPTRD
jgi:hypothetical protein